MVYQFLFCGKECLFRECFDFDIILFVPDTVPQTEFIAANFIAMALKGYPCYFHLYNVVIVHRVADIPHAIFSFDINLHVLVIFLLIRILLLLSLSHSIPSLPQTQSVDMA